MRAALSERAHSQRLEAQIQAAHVKLLTGKTTEERRSAWFHMASLIGMRSAQQIIRMERSQGLRA